MRSLEKSGVGAEAIHGNKSQGQRERVLAAFRDGRVRNLVATDIAARGIDVVGISHVINFDMPNDPESYVHRIGRTARAGRTGTAISFCSAEELPFLRSIEKLIRRSLIEVPGGKIFDHAPPASVRTPARGRSRRGASRPPQAKRAPHRGDTARAGPVRQGDLTHHRNRGG